MDRFPHAAVDDPESDRLLASAEPEIPDTLLVESRLAAAQWELSLAEPRLRAGAAAWPSPAVLPYRSWTERLWTAHRPDASPALLGEAQSAALWREVIADSSEGAGLVGLTGFARWARDARRRLRAWNIGPGPVGTAGANPDLAAFVLWHERYIERLADAGWIDGADLDAALSRLPAPPAARVEIAPPFEPTPAREALLDHLRRAGWRVRARGPASARASAVQARLADDRAELQAAAHWARRRLERSPGTRVAVVVCDLPRRAAEARRIFGSAGIAAEALYVRAADARADARPLIGAALNALELLSPRGTFVELSRWLRSPFFGAGDARTPEGAAAARLEAQWRTEVGAQLPFAEAYRRTGLRDRLHASTPALAARLDAAWAEVTPAAALRAPSHWARLWQQALRGLGWVAAAEQGSDAGGEAFTEEVRAWEKALRDLALLTPILGRISVERALAELERTLDAGDRAGPLPLAGVHVLGDLADVGPGYTAAWITGLTATAFPLPVALNPLLPRSLQVEHGMPWSSPQDALARSRALLGFLREQVGELVLSWPARENDEQAAPSPLIRDLPGFDPGVLGVAERRARAFPSPRRRETARESARIPAAPGVLSGGTRALDATARCPLRAFCEHRLGARPLEPLARGLSGRLKGIALHGALESFYRLYKRQADLAGAPPEVLRRVLGNCIEAALDGVFGAARAPLEHLFELERRRQAAILEAFLRRETERSPFEVEALEHRQAVSLDRWQIQVRADRIDALDDGSLAIVDYKTGRAARPTGWFEPLPKDSQLPVYAVAAGGRVSALVVASLGGARTAGYGGLWSRPGDFPGRPLRPPSATELAERIASWRRAIERLIADFAGGDVGIDASDPEPARGPFGPLSRVQEQLALRRGWIEPW